MSGDRIIEMTWRCSACAHQNLGRHMICQRCGDPKDEREQYEMPANTAAAATVSDPAHLRMARADANWRCAYCGSDQRALDGGCARCGAGRTVGANARPPAVLAKPAHRGCAPIAIALGVVAFAFVAIVVFAVLARGGGHALQATSLPPIEPTEIVAQVTGVAWTHTVHLDRWSLLDGEGFAENKPEGALDVKQLPPRVHHHEQVLDHYDTETYTVQEPDGFDTQTYTEQVPCGQTCTTLPRTCTEQCTSQKNGFASCRQVCTGGGQSCTPKTCSETRTRQVPRTKTVTKTRQVPRYRDEPRMAPWFSWHVWGWKEVRSETATGTTNETRWPIVSDAGASGAKERERKDALYRVALVDYAGRAREATLTDARIFATLVPGSWHRIQAPSADAAAVQIAD